jgi:PIN domain nuclease of toxin-antitoxin system
VTRAAVLLDTCVLIYKAQGLRLKREAEVAIEQSSAAGTIHISPVSAWEIGMLSRPSRKVPLMPAEDARLLVSTVFGRADVVEAAMTPAIAFEASHLPGEVHADPFDQVLIATARALSLPLVTDDRRILAYAAQGHVKALAC